MGAVVLAWHTRTCFFFLRACVVHLPTLLALLVEEEPPMQEPQADAHDLGDEVPLCTQRTKASQDSSSQAGSSLSWFTALLVVTRHAWSACWGRSVNCSRHLSRRMDRLSQKPKSMYNTPRTSLSSSNTTRVQYQRPSQLLLVATSPPWALATCWLFR